MNTDECFIVTIPLYFLLFVIQVTVAVGNICIDFAMAGPDGSLVAQIALVTQEDGVYVMNNCFKITAFFLLLTVLLIQVSLPVSANHSDTISLNANTLTYSISGGNITEVTPIPVRGGESFELSGTVREGETITLTVNGISSASSDSDYVRAEVSARIGQYQPGDSTNSDSDKSEYPVYGGSKQLSVSIPVIGNENVGFSAGNTLRFYRSGMYHNRTIYISGTLEVISDPQPPPDPEPQQDPEPDPEPQPEPEPDVEPSLQITNCRERLKVDENFTLALNMEGFPRNTMPIFQVTSGEEYAFVSDSGVVTGVSPGQAVITVSASTGLPENQLISTTCSIEIYENTIEIINAPPYLRVDHSTRLEVLVNGKPPLRSVDWFVSEQSYNYAIFAGRNGDLLYGISPGVATVYARYETDDGELITASTAIEVVENLIIITPSEFTIGEGQSIHLSVDDEARRQGVVWESSDPSVLEVSRDGIVFARKAGGPVIITAHLRQDSAFSGRATATVLPEDEWLKDIMEWLDLLEEWLREIDEEGDIDWTVLGADATPQERIQVILDNIIEASRNSILSRIIGLISDPVRNNSQITDLLVDLMGPAANTTVAIINGLSSNSEPTLVRSNWQDPDWATREIRKQTEAKWVPVEDLSDEELRNELAEWLEFRHIVRVQMYEAFTEFHRAVGGTGRVHFDRPQTLTDVTIENIQRTSLNLHVNLEYMSLTTQRTNEVMREMDARRPTEENISKPVVNPPPPSPPSIYRPIEHPTEPQR